MVMWEELKIGLFFSFSVVVIVLRGNLFSGVTNTNSTLPQTRGKRNDKLAALLFHFTDIKKCSYRSVSENICFLFKTYLKVIKV